MSSQEINPIIRPVEADIMEALRIPYLSTRFENNSDIKLVYVNL
jgi:hypothetical protein